MHFEILRVKNFMNKAGLVDQLVQETGVQKKEAEKLLNSLGTIIARSLKKGEKIVLTGFGTFLVSKRALRKGRNPHTGEALMIQPSRIPWFRPGKEFKRLLTQNMK